VSSPKGWEVVGGRGRVRGARVDRLGGSADRMDNQAYTDAGALLVPQVVFAPSVFAAETAFSSFAADRKVNWAYTDAGALFVPRVAFAPSVKKTSHFFRIPSVLVTLPQRRC
jgi:hypothetical protein